MVLFIGQGLPPDLGALWRPPQSLDDGFDHKKLVHTAPHPVWRVRENGGDEFAIKEYRVAQASDLRTCLKEVAIVYRQRHPVERRDQSTFPRGGQELLLPPDALVPARITRPVG